MRISVNDLEITPSAIETEIALCLKDGLTEEEAKETAIRALIIDEVLYQEAIKQNPSLKSDDKMETIENFLKEIIQEPVITEEELKEFYDAQNEGGNTFPSFEEIKEDLTSFLEKEKWTEDFHVILEGLIAKSEIEGFDFMGDNNTECCSDQCGCK